MSKEHEALKLALEALEKLWNIIDDIDTYGDMAKADEKLYRLLVERRQRTRFEETGISTDGYMLDGGAITAIREALAEQPAQQQEPVAWIVDFDDGHVETTTRPVSDWKRGMWESAGKRFTVKPLYTSPQPSKPLTDAQIGAVAADIWCSVLIAPQSYQAFARAIEAAHGITGETK